jgi:tRNA(Ile)-lysidine synthase
VSDLLERVRAGGLLAPGRPVLVLLSGGQDSVCLLDLAVRIAGASGVSALHCNYGRREEAAGDEAHCAALCERLGVALHVHRAGRPTGNLQAWARDERYREARRLAPDRDVAAGHTASDQVETVLYRLAASPGRRALLGMAPREGRLIRPLLSVSRADTAAHCEARGLTWREDASNARFARGGIRHDLLPALRAIHPAAEENVLRTLELLRDEAAVLDAAVDDALAHAGDPPALDALRALPPALRRLALQRLADRAAGAGPPAPAIGHRAAEVLALGEGGALDVGGGLRAEIRGGAVRFGASRGPAAPHPRRAPS